MAPGPPDKLSSNRFFALADFIENPSKRAKRDDFPALPNPTNTTTNSPKYIVITSTDENKQLSKLSPFAIKKGLENISTETNSISLLRDGSLLVLARNTRTADKFLRTKSLSNLCPISCKLHKSLNSVKGVIYAPCLIHVPENEIVHEMKDQGVIDIYKFTRPSEDGKTRTATGKIIVTFNLHRLPTTVDVAWYKCKVEHYIPNPMRCKNCQLLGHTKNRCNGTPNCPDCSLPPHTPEPCTRIFCINCSGEHSAADNKCPRFVQMKEILKIKTINYCSIGEARRQYRESNPAPASTQNTYANITSGSPTRRKEPSNIQTIKNTASQNKNTNKQQITEINQSIKNTKENVTPKTDELSNKHEIPKTNFTITGKTESTKPTTSTKKNNTTDSIKSNTNIPLSPISHLTQSLIENSEYFITSSDEESLDKVTMDLANK